MALAPELVHQRLRAVSGRFRWARAGRYLISGMAVSFFCLILFLLVDTQFHVGAVGRWLGFVLILAPLVAGVTKAIPAFLQPLPELAIARRIEEACAGSGNALINAVQFDRELRPGSALRSAVFNELSDPFPRVNWSQVFDLRLLRKLGVALGVAAFIIFLWALIRPAAFANSVARVVLPAGNIAPLTRTRLGRLEPGNTAVTHGSELVLSVRLVDDVPRAAWVRFRYAGGSWQREMLSREVGTSEFAYRWKEVRQPMEYYVEAGDLQTDVYRVAVRAKTAIKTRTAEIEPPAYTQLSKRTVSGFTALEGVLPGSNVTFALDFNNAVAALGATDDKGQAIAATKIDEHRWRLPVAVAANRSLTLTFQDADDISGKETLLITTKADEAPKLTVSQPIEGHELIAAVGSSLDVQFSASDDFALGGAAIYRSTAEKPDAELIQDFPTAGGQKTFVGTAKIPLAAYLNGKEERVTFCVVARDANDATGPGVTISRPLVVALSTPEKIQQQAAEAAAKLDRGLRDLIKLQTTNLDETEAVLKGNLLPFEAGLPALLNRQVAVGDAGRELSASAEAIAPPVRETLRSLVQEEIPAAVLALRNAGSASARRAENLAEAVKLETLILTRLQSAPTKAGDEARRAEIQGLISGVDGLLRDQRAIQKDTQAAAPAAEAVSDRQDKLADQAVKVRKDVEKSAGNASLGDTDLRARLGKIAAMFGEFKIYEEMLAAADSVGSKAFPAALAKQETIVANLAKMTALLNQWQLAQAGARGDEMRKQAEAMKAKLDALANLQRDVLEKSKELARKDQFSADDKSTAEEIQRTKDLMAKVVEQMLTDAAVFPDMNISNELRGQLTSIFEDVKQTDADAIAKNQLKPSDIPVQKEDWLMKAIEDTKKIPEDMEMFLPNSSDTGNWLLENFDKTEIPNLENLPLPDEFTDVIGELQKEQESVQEKAQDAASNQVILAMQQGGPIMDGPQSGYSAQGKSGNERPMDIEQSGRSSGGREGESNGEMVGKVADDLEGRKTKARRTNEAMQSGNVEDHSGKEADAKATGGGKASGFSQREGMEGQAPVRGSNAPRQAANSALEAAQAILAQKTSKKAAAASLLFLRSDKLSGVAGLMTESATALREGRVGDFQGLHKKIMAQLNAAKGEIVSGKVLSLATGESARKDDQQMLGGGEGEAPAAYKDRVADYYRALADGK